MPRPDRWRRGEQVTARKLNEGVNAIRQLQASIPGDSQVDYPSKRPGGSSARFLLKAVEEDHLVCREWDGVTEGETSINVAKPWLLRVHPFDDEDYERAGETYEYWNSTTRTRTDAAGATSYEHIKPEYVEDDNVFGTPSPVGTTGVEDCDWLQISESRIWADYPHAGGYVIGGSRYPDMAMWAAADVKAYVEDHWSVKTPQADGEVRGEGAACSIDEAIFIVGPASDHDFSGGATRKNADCWRYFENAWSFHSTHPAHGFRHMAMVSVGEHAYFYGGEMVVGSGWQAQGGCFKLTPATPNWATLGDMPDSGGTTNGHADHEASVIGTGVFISGGFFDPTHSLNTMMRHETDDDTWNDTVGDPLDTMTDERQDHAQLSLDGFCYVFGGHQRGVGSVQLDSIEKYDVDGDLWTVVTDLLQDTSRGMGAFKLQTLGDLDRGYITGGWNDDPDDRYYHHENQRFQNETITQATPEAIWNRGRRYHQCATLA